MTSSFQTLRNFRLHKFHPLLQLPEQNQELKNNIILTNKNNVQYKRQQSRNQSIQSPSSRRSIQKREVKKIIGKAQLDSPEYGSYTFYLIKWKSKTFAQATWQHSQHLENSVRKITSFNFNIKDQPLPYFHPKYISLELNYKKILQKFVQNFLQTKRIQKQEQKQYNLNIKPEKYDDDQKSSYQSKLNTKSKQKQKTKKIKKNVTVKQQSKKNKNKRKSKSKKEKKDKSHSLFYAAIRECFQSRIRYSLSKKSDQTKQEDQRQLGQILNSPVFSEDSISERSDLDEGQSIHKKEKCEQDSFQDLVYFSEIENKADHEIKQQGINYESTNEKIEYCENKNEQYQPEPGEIVLNDQYLIYSKFVEEDELIDVKYNFFN